MNKRTLKDLTTMLLEAKETDEEKKKQIAINFGLNQKDVTSKLVVCAELVKQAKEENLRAIEILRDIQKERNSPIDNFLEW